MATVQPPILSPSTKFADDDSLYEIVKGERKENAPMGVFACLIASELSRILGNYGRQHKLGLPFVETHFQLTNDVARRPDVAFVKLQDLPPNLEDDPAVLELPPSIAVEVVSPTNTANEIETKIHEYFDSGTDLVWVVFPRHRHLRVYDSFATSRLVTESEEADGGSVLPGLRFRLKDLFDILPADK